MLQRSNYVHEVSMFSLIALYFEYRKAKAAHIAAMSMALNHGRPANDADAIGVAKAA